MISVVLTAVVGLAIGYLIGGRHSDNYWADHDRNGVVQHRGKFYSVSVYSDDD